MLHRTLRTIATSIALVGALAVPSVADDTSSATPTPSATAADAQTALGTQFTSLTSALMNVYAQQSGMSLGQYIAANSLTISTTQAADGSQASTLNAGGSGQQLAGDSVETVDSQLQAAGLTLDLSRYTSLADMADDVTSKANTADGAVTLAGATWATQLATLRTPGLSSPTVTVPNMPDVPQEALAFGLLLDQAIAKTVTSAPDLFAQANSTGVGSDALASQFSASMMEAFTASSQDLTSVLPDQCTGGMLAVMASGDASSADAYGSCDTSCVVGGLYLNGQASMMMSPSANSIWGDSSQSLWSNSTLLSIKPWQQQQLLEQNPDLVQQMLAGQQSASTGAACSTASTSSKAALSDTLPGVFGQLKVG